MTVILDGLKLSRKIETDLAKKISGFTHVPKLAIIQIGEKKESGAYIARKIQFAKNIGALVEHIKLPDTSTQKEIIAHLTRLNADTAIHGIIIQLPLSPQLDFSELVETISWQKDVDGLGSKNVKGLWQNSQETLMPATVQGIIELLNEYKIPLAGGKALIVNRSILVGRPLALALINRDATVTVAHSKTQSLEEEMRRADIIVTAVGKPKIFGKEFFREGQTVVDVGISYGNQKVLEETKGPKLSGDVDFEQVKDVVKAISPVPGGVGPMTVVCLFKNLLKAYEFQI